MNKMVMVVTPQDEAEAVLRALIAAGHTATFSDSRGGVLRQTQQMLFIAVAEKELNKILSIIRDNCRTQVEVNAPQLAAKRLLSPIPHTTAKLGGAVVFVWDIEYFEVY